MRMDPFACRKGVMLDVSRPGKPTGHASIEPFNDKRHAECLNACRFVSLDDAWAEVGAWPGVGW